MNANMLKGHGAMLGANVMWGLLSPVAKSLMLGGVLSPLIVMDFRVAGAMILFWIISFFRPAEHVPPKDLIKLFYASLLAIIFNQGSFIFGVGLSSPVDASIITTSMPLIAMILAAVYLKEPITGKKIIGIALGACGALILILSGGNKSVTVGAHPILGDILVLLAQCSYALYIVLFKDFVGRYSVVTIMKWMFTYSFLCLLPFSYDGLISIDWSLLDMSDYAGIVYVSVCGTFLSYLLVVCGQKALRPTVAGMYNYVQPLVATIAAVIWGMDTFGISKTISALLIFGGVYLVTMSKSRADLAKH